MLWYTLEVPHQVASNEYPQHMILWRNKKKWYVATSSYPNYHFFADQDQMCHDSLPLIQQLFL